MATGPMRKQDLFTFISMSSHIVLIVFSTLLWFKFLSNGRKCALEIRIEIMSKKTFQIITFWGMCSDLTM